MTTQTETRFTDALALSQSRIMDTTKLSALINLSITEGDRELLWKNIKEGGEIKRTRIFTGLTELLS